MPVQGGYWTQAARAAIVVLGLLGAGGAWAATTVDLGISAYTWSPNLVVHNGTATFSATVTNNDQFSSADGLTLTVALPSNVDFSTATTASTLPSGCTLPSPYTTLTCTKTTLAALATWTVSFNGIGLTAGVQNSTASIVATANTDNNAGNDSLTQPVTEINGADLSVTTTGVSGCSGTTSGTTTCATTAGSNYSFTVNVSNNGPDAASTFNVTNNLPAVADFTYTSASGTGWSCSHTGTTVTCGYSGLNSSASAAPITITGTVITSAGTITDGASVASTDALTGDPVSGNNGPSQVVVNVVPGTNLQANKTLVSAVTGLTSFTAGEAVNLTLSASNSGTQSAAGVSVSDTISGDFSIPSPLGVSGCSATGQVVTCTVGALAAGATSSPFVIPLTVVASPTLGSGSNSASVARTDGTAGSNTPVTVNYSIVAPFAHLTLTKTKTPNPVVNAGTMTSTITVTNSSSSTSAATGTITVTDALGPNEAFQSYSGSGWSCSGLSVGATSGTLTCNYASANLARGAFLPNLLILTQATGISVNSPQSISNTACTGSSISTGQSPLDNAANTCVSKTITASLNHVDLTVAKVASIAAPAHVLSTDSSYTYTLTVSNAAGKDTAPTVNVTDSLPEWYSANVLNSAVITSSGTGESCSVGSTVTCTLKNLAGGSSRTITITLNRPVKDGSFTNTATVSTSDAIDDVPGNNSGSASVIIDPVSDVAVTGIADAPHPVKVGQTLTYTTSIKNNGPSVAANVVVYHSIDASKMIYVTGSASLTGSGSPSCAYVSPFTDGLLNNGSIGGIRCTVASMADGESRQLTFSVIPVYPYPGASPFPVNYASNAAITTTTAESSSSNNTLSNTASVTIQALDLSVTNTDSGYDPVGFGNSIIYQVTASNNGPSQATNFKLTVTPTPPPQGSQLNAYTMIYDAAKSTLPGASCSPSGSNVVCVLSGSDILAANASADFQLAFDTGPSTNTPPTSITYATTAVVSSDETTAGYDSLPGNNSVTQTTTALPVTDLAVISKSVSAGSPFNLNQPFTYTVVVGNYGPSPASGVKVTDILPAGLVVNGTLSAALGSGALTSNSCTSSGSPVTVICALGTLPVASSSSDTPNLVTITIPVRAAYQSSGNYAFSFNTNLPNTATIVPLPNTSYDPTSGNDTSNTVNVQIQKSSIAGTVYSDNNLNDAVDSGEGLNAVTLTLSGMDSYGYAYGSGLTNPALTATSNSSGVFTFDKLPPGTWQIVETQPSGYSDRFEAAGSAGGTVPAATCDGSTNCASSAAANTISAISLPAATAATGYVFQEYKNATISGIVYSDLNNTGAKDGSEAGISGVTLTLTGTTYNGTVYSGTTLIKHTDPSGFYTFTVPPADASGYTVTEVQPSGYLNGKTTAGTVSGTNAVAGTATGANSDVIQAIKVYANGSSNNNNFGELLPATLSGYVYIDTNSNAKQDSGETSGVTSVTVTLTGTDDLNAAVSLTTTTTTNGAYSFTSLRPGVYAVAESQPASLTLTGAQVGTKGGTINGSVRSAGTGVAGSGNNAISAITMLANDTASGYNFGESGQGLSGYVYVDLNNNGVKDTGEPGIAGVTVTLSGATGDGVDVCVAISPNPCTVTTDSNGAYSFVGLPASNGAGYTLTEQSQATAPLSSYADGLEQLGTGLATPGTANNDNFSGINVPTAGFGNNYNFGEKGGSLSGLVYYDKDNSGGFNGGDSGLSGVTIVLSGTGCNSLPAGWCTTTTASDGTYSFTGLPTGSYTLTETQPVDYANGTTAAGTPAGTTTGTTISAIPLTTAGANGSGYNFGEKANTLSGYVYVDANNDGIKGGGETGISGVTVTLSGNTASGANVCTTCTTTTDANGLYTFSGLGVAGAGGYTVTLTPPSGYLAGKVTAGMQNSVTLGTVASQSIGSITFAANYPGINYNFGELQATSISGTVYLDVNNNGVQDGGDLGLTGVAIALSGTNDLNAAVSASTPTASDGTWSFTGLRPGTYTVTETQPLNYAEGTNNLGTTGGASATNAGVSSQFTGIVVASGTVASNYRFGEKGGVVSGYVYVDANDNGSKDSGEAGISGVTVTLAGTTLSGVDVCTLITCGLTTGSDGGYTFAALPAANASGYTITESQPAAYLDGKETAGNLGGTVDNHSFGSAPAQNKIAAIPLVAGSTASNNNFGETQAASISGVVYLDANDNGIQDAGDAGLSGVTLTLSGTDDQGTVNTSVQSGSDGSWSFTNLRPGSYAVTETQPVNYADRSNTVGSAGGAASVVAGNSRFSGMTLTSGTVGTGYLFGEKGSAILGFVYLDANNDGIKQSGEAGIGGVTLTLSGFAASNVNVCTLVTCTVTSAVDGSYAFTVLPSANASGYTITESQPAAYLDGKETAGSLGGTVDNATYTSNAAQNKIAAIPFTAAISSTGNNFGEVQGSAISGRVYLDVNGNGVLDSADTGMSGVTISLTGTDDQGTVNLSIQTAADGSWSFPGLRPGSYTITETQPLDYAEGGNTVGGSGGTVGLSGKNSQFTGVTLVSGGNGGGYYFGEQTNTLSGSVYLDANDNGIKDSGETGISGVTVTLSGNTVSGVNICSIIPSCTAISDANGLYSFAGLRNAGTGGYTLTESQPASYLDGKETAGSQSGTVDNSSFGNTPAQNKITAIPFNAASAATGYGFGEVQQTALAGVVYLDANNDGIQNNGETGISGVTVTLSGNDDQGQSVNQTVVTDANGAYGFTGLRPSSTAGYVLTETQPTAYLDGLETAGTLGGTVNSASFGSDAAQNQISAIVLGSGLSGSGYLFGERGGTLHGYVYFDENNDGLMAGVKEIGLKGITVTLSGTISGGGDVCAVIPTCSTTTDANGAYSFVVPPGSYTLQKSQSDVATKYLNASNQALYDDGMETAGVAGGTVDNSHFGSNPGYNSITSIAVTPAILASNNGDLGGYLFGVVTPTVPEPSLLVPPVISGYVYQDLSHKRIRPATGSTPSLVNGWTVTLTATLSDNSKEVICVVQTAADANGDPGFYHFDNLACAAAYPKWKSGLPYSGWVSSPGVTYSSFAISFSNPGGVVSNTDAQSLGGAGTPKTIGSAAQIAAIILHPGDDIIEQNLPLDPSGVVYDAISRQPIKGAVVTLLLAGTAVDSTCLVSQQNPETTGSDGFYQFLLLQNPGCPNGTNLHFTLVVLAPSGYASGSSTMISPTAPPLSRFDGTPASLGDVDPIQSQAGPPALGGLTRYYLNIPLTLTGVAATSSSNVVNNHIPLDPVSPGVILMSKSTPLLNVAKGDLVPYTVTATNQAAGNLPLGNIDVVDTIPPGFAYKKGTAVLGSAHSEPLINGRTLTWKPLSFTGGEKKTWKMLLTVGAGVSEGEYTNLVWAINDLTGGVDSNVAAATVRIVPDPTFDCSEIIGKVFDDKNANGYEDEGEPGIPAVRVATVNGLLVSTDPFGRFHVACADIPQDLRGSNFIMKLDERTLPSGYRVTTENPRVVRTTLGKMVKLNFGAAIHRVVRLELSDAAFKAGKSEPGSALEKAITRLPSTLRVHPSLVRLAYRRGKVGDDLAKARIKEVRERIEKLWKAEGCCYTLLFEDEVFERATRSVK